MVKPKNILNIMIEMPEYFNNWLYINDFAFKVHSIKNNTVEFQSKKYKATINSIPMCRIESKVDSEIIFVFRIPRERTKFYELIEIFSKTIGLTVAQKVG